MANLIALIISVPVSAVTFALVMRYNLHMFQLNGYKNNEFRSWIKKNYRKQLLLVLSGILGVLAIIFPNVVCMGLLIICWLIVCKYYGYLKKNNTKKKLVYTARVKRQIATNLLLNITLGVVVVILTGYEYLPGVLGITIPWQAWILLPVNILNRPVEKAVGQYYINDAKKKLQSVSGIKVIGVTGSYGKTSVKFYLQTLLQGKYNVLVTPESYNTPMGVVKTIRESLKPSHEIFVCEMGARYVGDIKEICDIVHPDYGMITSIGPQHLETFGGMEQVVNTKFELADALKEGSLLFLNGDNEWIQSKVDTYTQKGLKPVLYRSRTDGEGYRVENVKLSSLGTEFDVVTPSGERENFKTRLVGEHNVINIMGAIATAHQLGVSLKELKVPVRRLQPVSHRMQMLLKGNVTIIDDAYNSNPVGSRAAVETLAMFEGIRILVTPGMVELGKAEDEYNYKFGTYAAACCDYILLIGREHVEPIRRGVLESGFPEDRCLTFEKLPDAITYAYAIRGEGHKYILLENDLPDHY